MANPKTGCRCGSGGHPRKCELHPWAYDLHRQEINLYGEIEELKERLDALTGVVEKLTN